MPHSVAVVIDAIQKREGGRFISMQRLLLNVRQKGIIIGKQGKMLKEVGKRARFDIEALLGSKVFLEVWVKVQKDWRNKMSQLRDLGFREDEY